MKLLSSGKKILKNPNVLICFPLKWSVNSTANKSSKREERLCTTTIQWQVSVLSNKWLPDYPAQSQLTQSTCTTTTHHHTNYRWGRGGEQAAMSCGCSSKRCCSQTGQTSSSNWWQSVYSKFACLLVWWMLRELSTTRNCECVQGGAVQCFTV